ncbi:terminase large subunit domain-containing protein, partial [Helicobacter baculiformis]
MDTQALKQELVLRALAKKDLYTFVKLKWARYNLAPFMHSWHIAYLCKVLECTLPTAQEDLITRLMINMPPSYGKTEIIARCFVAWALGLDRSRKFFYISYSDDLCRKIANQVRDLMKSKFYAQIFPEPLEFLQDNAQEFVLREGGGLFVTTLKSALTGFHAHQILIDDPIKVSEMSSKSAVKAVNSNFKESVLSRLQDNQSNITLLMQRLGGNDLCGFLLSEREFEPESIACWHVLKLQALNQEEQTYAIKDFTYTRPPQTPLFEARHNLEQLEALRLQMG